MAQTDNPDSVRPKIRRALISVYDKTGLVDFARALHDEFGIEIISTGGTAKTLQDAGIPVTLVEQVTGFPELMDGRVKTLHPRIHAAILADRDNPEHMRQLAEHGIEPIDMVVVNLYPFEKTIAQPGCTFEQAIEMIDIGGPCLLRAAAKNHKHVLVLCDAEEWPHAIDCLRRTDLDDSTWEWIRRSNAARVYALTSEYDRAVRAYLAKAAELPIYEHLLEMMSEGALRYGENPHQRAELMRVAGWLNRLAPIGSSQVEVSFNNHLDASAAYDLCAELTRATAEGSAKLCFASGTSKLRFEARAGSEHEQPPRYTTIRDDLLQRRKLPHWQRPGATYWITFTSALGELRPAERDSVMAALRHWDGTRLDLLAAVVMPDHVHVLLAPREIEGRTGEYHNLSALLQSIKAFSGREISQGRGGVGQVWTRESFDRWIRSEDDLIEKYRYLAENVVKEGLADTPAEYRWWYALDVLGIGVGVPVAEDPRERRLSEEVADEDQGTNATGNNKAEPCSPRSNKAELCPPLIKAELCSPHAVCFIKHTNACGAAVDADPVEAYRRAYLGDPNAAMGGILAVNFNVDAAFAEAVMETYARWGKPLKDAGAAYAPGAFFIEVWIAPSFDEDAVRLIRGELEPTTERPNPPKKDWGRRVRLLAVGDMAIEPDPAELDHKRIAGGMLVQTRDLVGLNEEQWKVVTERSPTEQEMNDLRLAWLICKHTKSNTITICRDGMLLGNGAGQMSRVMSCRIAAWLAQENGHADVLKGAVAASDAFFPFRDGPDVLMNAGVTALIQPGGGKRDDDTIKACNERGVAMIFTGTRHFKH
jgi:AICAR transformylase/IMP cyclohydrolase PurH/REP element-mobilizing transposase RayT